MATQVLFYATPVLYPITILKNESLERLLFINPLGPIFEQVRVWVFEPDAPTASEVVGGAVHLQPAIAIFVGVCLLGVWVFNRDAPRIAEEL